MSKKLQELQTMKKQALCKCRRNADTLREEKRNNEYRQKTSKSAQYKGDKNKHCRKVRKQQALNTLYSTTKVGIEK